VLVAGVMPALASLQSASEPEVLGLDAIPVPAPADPVPDADLAPLAGSPPRVPSRPWPSPTGHAGGSARRAP
jgi:hypothetical protein